MPRFETEWTKGSAGAGDTFRGRPVRGLCVATSWFGEPRNNGVGFHTGGDFAPYAGEDLGYGAIAEAALEWVGVAPAGPAGRNANGGYGNVVLLRHPDGSSTLGAHLREFSGRIQAWIDGGYRPEARPYLSADELVGIVGNTGYVFPAPAHAGDLEAGRHLHFECRDSLGNYINPIAWMVDVDAVGTFSALVVEVDVMNEPPPEHDAERPPQLLLGPIGAFNEARLARTLFEFLAADPGPNTIEDVARMFEREAAEILVALGSYALEDGIEGGFEVLAAARELTEWMHRLGALYTRTRPSVATMAATGRNLADAIVNTLRPIVAV